MKIIAFDMDGTIADLYSVPNWLDRLRAEDPGPYVEAAPMWDMERLRDILLSLSAMGWEIRIISWLSKDSTPKYKKATRKAKRGWLSQYDFPADKIHLIQYGAIKSKCIGHMDGGTAILIDDNQKVRDSWHLGETIDPTVCDILKELEKLLER